MKRGQLTLFILIGVVVVGIIIVSVYMIGRNQAVNLNSEYFNSDSVKDSMSRVQNLILNCRDDVTLASLETIGIQGGYYNPPEKSYDLQWVVFPYYYYEGEFLMPEKSRIELELSEYTNEFFGECLNAQNFDEFSLSLTDVDTTSLILEDSVSFEIDVPITVTHNGNSIILEMKDFRKDYNFSLMDMIEVAEYLTDSHREDPAMYCISCLGEMAEERALYVDILQFEENTMMTIITNNNSFIDPYSFVFLNKYTGSEFSPDVLVEDFAPDAPSGESS